MKGGDVNGVVNITNTILSEGNYRKYWIIDDSDVPSTDYRQSIDRSVVDGNHPRHISSQSTVGEDIPARHRCGFRDYRA